MCLSFSYFNELVSEKSILNFDEYRYGYFLLVCMCVCVCVCECVSACVHACVCVNTQGYKIVAVNLSLFCSAISAL